MTTQEVIDLIFSKGYQGTTYFFRVTGEGDNTTLLQSVKINNKLYLNYFKYSSKSEALREVRRLIKIYIPVSSERRRKSCSLSLLL